MKSRKKLKGMTLIEIIISIAVFAVLGVILLGIGQVVDSTTKASSRLNKKMTVQAPYAAAKNVRSMDTDSDGVDDYYYYIDEAGNNVPVTPDNMNISVYFGSKTSPTKVKVQKYQLDSSGNLIKDADGKPIKDGDPVDEEAKSDLNANKYSTKELVKNNKLIYDANSPNANLDFQFVEIQPTP